MENLGTFSAEEICAHLDGRCAIQDLIILEDPDCVLIKKIGADQYEITYGQGDVCDS